jgi:mono/diheme cytochrome c family protein
MPTVLFGVAATISAILMVLIIRNPATHANLETPRDYDRTVIAYVGDKYLYAGYGTGLRRPEEAMDDGQVLFVTRGCVGCHGIYAQGSYVAGDLWRIDADDFARDAREGTEGMPHYDPSILSSIELESIYAWLEQAEAAAQEAGVTVPTVPTAQVAPTTAVPHDHLQTTVTSADPGNLTLSAPAASITVDGDPADWDGIEGLELTLVPIEERPDVAPVPAAIKVAHDGLSLFVLFAVEDDFDWSDVDPRLTGAPGVMWAIEDAAGPHMGGEDPSGEPGLGLVEIWYWRLECEMGVETPATTRHAAWMTGGPRTPIAATTMPARAQRTASWVSFFTATRPWAPRVLGTSRCSALW